MKTLAELKNIQNASIDTYNLDNARKSGIRIVVGMSTCSIAAGARQVYSALEDEVVKLNKNDIRISQVGCIGVCKYEPLMEIYMPNQEKTTYVKMTPEKVVEIINEHVINGNVLTDYTIS